MQVYIDPKVPEQVQKLAKAELKSLDIKADFVELIYNPGLQQIRVFDGGKRKTVARFYVRPNNSSAEETGETGSTRDDDNLDPDSGKDEKKVDRKVRRQGKRPAKKLHQNND
jgi:hypothetical protein